MGLWIVIVDWDHFVGLGFDIRHTVQKGLIFSNDSSSYFSDAQLIQVQVKDIFNFDSDCGLQVHSLGKLLFESWLPGYLHTSLPLALRSGSNYNKSLGDDHSLPWQGRHRHEELCSSHKFKDTAAGRQANSITGDNHNKSAWVGALCQGASGIKIGFMAFGLYRKGEYAWLQQDKQLVM